MSVSSAQAQQSVPADSVKNQCGSNSAFLAQSREAGNITSDVAMDSSKRSRFENHGGSFTDFVIIPMIEHSNIDKLSKG